MEQEMQKILSTNDFYQILNCNRDCNKDDLKKSYRKLALKFHPDKNKSKKAEECFKKINAAYYCLSDPTKKRRYDAGSMNNNDIFSTSNNENRGSNFHSHGFNDFDPNDIFSSFFGGGFFEEQFERQQFYRRKYSNRRNNTQNNQNNGNKNNKFAILQLIPILLILFFNFSGYIFNSDPIYSFDYSNKYYIRKTIKANKFTIVYYVNNKFNNKSRYEILDWEDTIYNEYYNRISNQCRQEWEQKNNLNYQYNWAYTQYRKDLIKNKLNRLSFRNCKIYEKLTGNRVY